MDAQTIIIHLRMEAQIIIIWASIITTHPRMEAQIMIIWASILGWTLMVWTSIICFQIMKPALLFSRSRPGYPNNNRVGFHFK